jgi:hypothetical protein
VYTFQFKLALFFISDVNDIAYSTVTGFTAEYAFTHFITERAMMLA